MAIDFRLLTMQKVVHQRVSSLMDDGFLLVFKSTLTSTGFYKLRHRTNGTTITLRAYYRENRLMQFTNGICVHDSRIWNSPKNDASI